MVRNGVAIEVISCHGDVKMSVNVPNVVLCVMLIVHIWSPDFCGMSMEMANKILTTIKSTRTPGKPLPPPPAAPLADQPNASSDASKFSSSTSDSKMRYFTEYFR